MSRYQGVQTLELLDKTAKNYNTFLQNLVVKEIKKIKNIKTIVDFGSGTGELASKIGQKTAHKIDCVEISENLFCYYKNKPNVALRKSLCEFENNSVDLIYSFNVLEHIKNDTDYIELFFQKIKQNGILILYLPAFMCLYSSMDQKVRHYRRYYKKDLLSKLQPHFKITSLKYADSAGFFITLLYKIIGNKNGDISRTALYIFDRFIFPLGRLFDFITFGQFFGKNIFCIAHKKIKENK